MSLMAAEKISPAPAGRHQLGDLVLTRKEALRLSYEKLAARCVDPETGEQTVKGSWLHRIATRQPVQAPDVSQLRGMAAGLEVSLRRVQDAAGAQFFGMDAVYTDDEQVRTALYHFEGMSEEDRERVLALMEAWRRRS
jgi:hypothetical protein